MTCYKNSTQSKEWIFTKDQLNQYRLESNQVTVAASLNQDNLLNGEEEMLLLSYYKKRMIDIGNTLNLPDQVYSTAIVYLNRFYLHKSVMEYSPKMVMICCIFLACKTEDNHLDIEFYSKFVKVEPKEIVDLELPIMETLHFQLLVYHPFRPLYGLLLDINDMQLQQYDNNNNQTTPEWLLKSSFSFDQLYQSCKTLIIKSIAGSDASFIFHPYQIALATLSIAWPQYFQFYFTYKFKDNVELLSTIDQIKQLIQSISYEQITPEVVKPIDMKLILLNKAKRKGTEEGGKKKKGGGGSSTKKQKKSKNNNNTTPTTVVIDSSTTQPVTTNDVIMLDSNNNNNGVE